MYHGHEFIFHILLRAVPKMPGLLRFLPQSYTQTEDLLKNITLDIKKKNKQNKTNLQHLKLQQTKQQTKIKLYYLFVLIILDRGME